MYTQYVCIVYNQSGHRIGYNLYILPWRLLFTLQVYINIMLYVLFFLFLRIDVNKLFFHFSLIVKWIVLKYSYRYSG